ncbi:DUF1648 domain-containing protein [uncultured Paludibaculum sp.]|uniref:DUF1648 domain-containing protein n=1 Tax=uncultured Paludibaculum sp. TaxID=1765020 RepID=UPI002AAB8487|nr:DUF1648 domain-containing protein [uncultured Paludibaculum sp.]
MISKEFVAPALTVLVFAVIYNMLPSLRKRDLYFGVTTDPAFRQSPIGHSITREYRLILWLSACAALILLAGTKPAPRYVVLIPLLVVAGGLTAWVRAWSRTRPHAIQPTALRSAPLLSDSDEHLPGGWATAIIPLGAQVLSFAYVISRYDDLPERFPVHWGASGQADRWADKSWSAVTASSLLGVIVTLVLLGTAWMILRNAKRGSGGETGDFGAKHRRGNVSMLVAMAWVLSLVFCFLSQLPLHPNLHNRQTFLLVLLPVGVALVKTFQLYRLSTSATGGSDGTPEECWKLGAFYYNPADPAILVEKRTGPGFTLNFGHRLSWLVMAGVLGVLLIPMLGLR